MDTQEAYGARLDAQMRAADARLDEMEAQARARDARAEMDEISGLRARRDQIRQQVTTAKQNLRSDRDATRDNVNNAWNEFRRSVADSHKRFTAWDEARERKLAARLDQADAALRESAAANTEVAADVRIELAAAQVELRAKTAEARREFDAWRERRKDERLQAKLDDAELELDEASNRYAAALSSVRQGGAESRTS
jgi:hypothetical protein